MRKNLHKSIVLKLAFPLLTVFGLVYTNILFSQKITSRYVLSVSETISANTINPRGGTVQLVYRLVSGATPIPGIGTSFNIPLTYTSMDPVTAGTTNNWNHLTSLTTTIGGVSYTYFMIIPYTGGPNEGPNNPNANTDPGGTGVGSIYHNIPNGNIKVFNTAPNPNNTDNFFTDKINNNQLSLTGYFDINVGAIPTANKVNVVDQKITTLTVGNNTSGWDPVLDEYFYDDGYWLKPINQTAVQPENRAANLPFDIAYNTTVPYKYAAYRYINGVSATSAGNRGVGFTGFIEFEYDESLLPVTLTHFTGTRSNNANILSWSTSMEQHNKGFEIERGTDALNWTKIAFVNSAAENNNSSTPLNYTYTDNSVATGNFYYRLKQVDLDGKYTYSSTISLSSATANMLTVFPNPATDVITITGLSNIKEIQILSADGKITNSYTVYRELVKSLSIKHLNNGIYFLRFTDTNGNISTQKILKN